MTGITDRLGRVIAQIQELERRHARAPGSVQLLAVSKTKSPRDVREAFQAGQRAFGENQLQEALRKLDAAELAGLDLEWHFIGPLQSNKTRPVAERFDWLHSLDRIKVARRLNEQRPPGLAPLNVCIQVNVDAEPTKSGVAPGELSALAADVAGFSRLKLCGLMALPRLETDFDAQRRPFRQLRQLLEGLRAEGHSVDTLSMGMTDDMEAAIAEGATWVRIGTAIFGPRPSKGDPIRDGNGPRSAG